MTPDPKLELHLPVEERSLPALKAQEKSLVELHGQMLGTLYPTVVRRDLGEVRREILYRETGHREIPGAGISIRES